MDMQDKINKMTVGNKLKGTACFNVTTRSSLGSGIE